MGFYGHLLIREKFRFMFKAWEEEGKKNTRAGSDFP